jgi:hypothetical protein
MVQTVYGRVLTAELWVFFFEGLLNKVELGQDFIRVFRFSPPSRLPPLFCTHFHPNTTVLRRTSWRNVETFKQSSAIRISGRNGQKRNVIFCTSSVLYLASRANLFIPKCHITPHATQIALQILNSKFPSKCSRQYIF